MTPSPRLQAPRHRVSMTGSPHPPRPGSRQGRRPGGARARLARPSLAPRPRQVLDAWLRRLLVHACTDEARRHRRHTVEVELTPIDHPTVRDSAITIAERDALERGFRRLDPEQRALIVLHHYLDLPLPEVAETMRIPVGTAKSRLHRALSAMRAALDADARTATEIAEGRFA